jgi:hypothetical protein
MKMGWLEDKALELNDRKNIFFIRRIITICEWVWVQEQLKLMGEIIWICMLTI